MTDPILLPITLPQSELFIVIHLLSLGKPTLGPLVSIMETKVEINRDVLVPQIHLYLRSGKATPGTSVGAAVGLDPAVSSL